MTLDGLRAFDGNVCETIRVLIGFHRTEAEMAQTVGGGWCRLDASCFCSTLYDKCVYIIDLYAIFRLDSWEGIPSDLPE